MSAPQNRAPEPEQLDLFAKPAQSATARRVAERLRVAHEALVEPERKTVAKPARTTKRSAA
jgi:hypothetical protein